MTRLSKILFAATLIAAPATVLADGDPPADGTGGGGGDGTAGGAPAGGDGTPAPAPGDGSMAPADGGAMMYTKENWPKAQGDRPLTLAKGMIEVHADVFVNLSADAVAKPISISPDIYYGVSEKLSVGLTHNLGLCLTGTDNGCAKVYNDVGLQAKFSVKRDAKMELAAAGGLILPSLDPMTARLELGVDFKYQAGKITIWALPRIGIGLNKRDGATDPITMTTIGGNKESLGLPVIVGFQATPELNVHVRTGIGGLGTGIEAGAPLDGFGDAFVIPLGIGALYAVSNKLDVGAEFFFPAVAGSDLASTDARGLLITGNIRL